MGVSAILSTLRYKLTKWLIQVTRVSSSVFTNTHFYIISGNTNNKRRGMKWNKLHGEFWQQP